MDVDAGEEKGESGRERGAAGAAAGAAGAAGAARLPIGGTPAGVAGVTPASPPPLRERGLQPSMLTDRLRERLRYMHYSLRTEEAYVYWVRDFVRWSGGRHPRDLGEEAVQAFLVMLANERRVAAATHRQALSALLFLYREVLGVDMPWLKDLGRPVTHKRLPVVLTQVEVQALLARLGNTPPPARAAAPPSGQGPHSPCGCSTAPACGCSKACACA